MNEEMITFFTDSPGACWFEPIKKQFTKVNKEVVIKPLSHMSNEKPNKYESSKR